MKLKFFLKYFFWFMSPVLILLLLFGIPSIVLTWRYSTRQTNTYSLNLLSLTRENIEQTLNESTFLSNFLDENVANRVQVRGLFWNSGYSYEDIQVMNNVMSIMDASADRTSYIKSIYIYVDNPYSHCLVSNTGLVDLSAMADQAWYQSYLNAPAGMATWAERRQASQYKFETTPLQIVTLYRRLANIHGVIVINMDANSLSEILQKQGISAGQTIAVTDSSGNLIFSNRDLPGFDPSSLVRFGSITGEKVGAGGQTFIATILTSPAYGWHYISLVPSSSAYQVSYFLINFMLAAALASVLIGFIVAFIGTRSNYRNLDSIINMFGAVGIEDEIPLRFQNVSNEYTLISKNILQTFVEQNNLKIQLARQQFEKKNAQLLALQSQLNPHFLFNTLESIDLEILAITKKPSAVNKMISDLSEILRYSLGGTDVLVPLEAEIRNTQRYINILNYRYEETLDVRWKYSPDDLDFPVMRLMLQPLVENAITHGLKRKRQNAVIRISIRHAGEFLRVTVLDTGAGMSRELLEEVRKNMDLPDAGGHIGLNNTNRRLILTYSEESKLFIMSSPGLGTSIHFKIPDIIQGQ